MLDMMTYFKDSIMKEPLILTGPELLMAAINISYESVPKLGGQLSTKRTSALFSPSSEFKKFPLIYPLMQTKLHWFLKNY